MRTISIIINIFKIESFIIVIVYGKGNLMKNTAIAGLIRETEKLLYDITPLSLSLLRLKIINLVKKYGYINDPYFFQIIGAYNAYSGKNKTAEIFLEKSKNFSSNKDDMLCFNRGLIYLHMEDFEKAKLSALNCLKIDPYNISCLRLLMEIYHINGNEKKFYEIFDKLSNISFRLHEYIVIAGFAYKHGNNKYSEKYIHYVFSQLVLYYGTTKGKSFNDSLSESIKHLMIISKMTSPYSEKASQYFLENNLDSYDYKNNNIEILYI